MLRELGDGRVELAGDGGRVLARAQLVRGRDPVWAENLERPEGVGPGEAAAQVVVDLRGCRAATADEELAAALAAAGAQPVRHAHVMVAPTGSGGQGPRLAFTDGAVAGWDAAQDDRAEALAPARLAAYPPGHPDRAADSLAAAVGDLRAIIAGQVTGPLRHDLSAVLVGGDGRLQGGVLVTQTPEDPVWGPGPWITDLFVHPDYAGRGWGSALLQQVLRSAAHARDPEVALAVTTTNPAVQTYRRAGFTVLLTTWALLLPT